MCATGLVAPLKKGVTVAKTSKLSIDRILASGSALDRRRDRLVARCAGRTRRGGIGCRLDRRMFGTVCRKSEGWALNIQFIIAVAVGGSIGSVARYLVGIGSGKLFGTDFPWGTLIINVTGSFLIGAFVGLFALKWNLPQAMRLFLTVGICGGYTTFSTFSLDAWYLIERGQSWASAAYMIGSVVLSVGALIAALQLVRALP
jgi:fluoride exporter